MRATNELMRQLNIRDPHPGYDANIDDAGLQAAMRMRCRRGSINEKRSHAVDKMAKPFFAPLIRFKDNGSVLPQMATLR
jgi:hypothetical protein